MSDAPTHFWSMISGVQRSFNEILFFGWDSSTAIRRRTCPIEEVQDRPNQPGDAAEVENTRPAHRWWRKDSWNGQHHDSPKLRAAVAICSNHASFARRSLKYFGSHRPVTRCYQSQLTHLASKVCVDGKMTPWQKPWTTRRQTTAGQLPIVANFGVRRLSSEQSVMETRSMILPPNFFAICPPGTCVTT